MTREILIFRQRHQKSPSHGHVAFLELEFQHKGKKITKKKKKKKKKKNAYFHQNLVVFSVATDSEDEIIQILLRKR